MTLTIKGDIKCNVISSIRGKSHVELCSVSVSGVNSTVVLTC